MGSPQQFDHARRQQIYEFVERSGAVEPETVRRHVLVQPESNSTPARSGGDLDPSQPMSTGEFNHHVSILKRDGYLEEQNGKLRVVLSTAKDVKTVRVDGLAATVRPARQEDLADIVRVIETVAAADAYVVAARLAEELGHDDVLLRNNRNGSRVFFVATVDEDAVGWLHVGGRQFPATSHTAELTLGVLERYRGGGLGSLLMENGLRWAREQGYRKIYQSLPATNERAIAFLEGHGWSVEATRDGHYCISGELVDEIQLAVWVDDTNP